MIVINVNQSIKGYRIMQELGSGSYSRVFKVMKETTFEIYALKCMQNKKKTIQNKVFETEIKVLEMCKSQYVIRLVEHFQIENIAYIVFQCCEKQTLAHYIQRKNQIPEQQAILILKQILHGLSDLHNINAIHRDLKPANILKKDGKYKIADLGFSKILEIGGLTKTQKGSPAYIAPEIIEGRSYGFKVDIWSIGIIFYQMLHGRRPFKFNDVNNLKAMLPIMNQNRLNIDEELVSPQAASFIRGALSIDVSSRMNLKAVLEHKLFVPKRKYSICNQIYKIPSAIEISATQCKEGEEQIDIFEQIFRQNEEKSQEPQFMNKLSESMKLVEKSNQQRMINMRKIYAEHLEIEKQFSTYSKIINLEKNKLFLLLNHIIIIGDQNFLTLLNESRTISQIRLLVSYRCMRRAYLFEQFYTKKQNIFKFAYNQQYKLTNDYMTLQYEHQCVYQATKILYTQISENVRRLEDPINQIIKDKMKSVFKRQEYLHHQKIKNGHEGLDYTEEEHKILIAQLVSKAKDKLTIINLTSPSKHLYVFVYVLGLYKQLSQFLGNAIDQGQIDIINRKITRVLFCVQKKSWQAKTLKLINSL